MGNARGRAETARIILAFAGVRYTDQRLNSEQFTNVKSKLPYGQLPLLKVDGEVVCQSRSIARYLANQFGLAGKTNLERAQADVIPKTMGQLEARLIERGGQFFAGNALSWADLHVFAFVDRMRLDNPELLDEYPKMKNLIERIELEPNIVNWLKSRPQSLW